MPELALDHDCSRSRESARRDTRRPGRRLRLPPECDTRPQPPVGGCARRHARRSGHRAAPVRAEACDAAVAVQRIRATLQVVADAASPVAVRLCLRAPGILGETARGPDQEGPRRRKVEGYTRCEPERASSIIRGRARETAGQVRQTNDGRARDERSRHGSPSAGRAGLFRRVQQGGGPVTPPPPPPQKPRPLPFPDGRYELKSFARGAQTTSSHTAFSPAPTRAQAALSRRPEKARRPIMSTSWTSRATVFTT